MDIFDTMKSFSEKLEIEKHVLFNHYDNHHDFLKCVKYEKIKGSDKFIHFQIPKYIK